MDITGVAAAAALANLRWRNTTPDQRSAAASSAASAYWARLSPDARSAEMRRRAAVRARHRAAQGPKVPRA